MTENNIMTNTLVSIRRIFLQNYGISMYTVTSTNGVLQQLSNIHHYQNHKKNVAQESLLACVRVTGPTHTCLSFLYSFSIPSLSQHTSEA